MAEDTLNKSNELDVNVSTFDPASTRPDYPQILMQSQKDMLATLDFNFQKNLQTFKELEPKLFAQIKSYAFRQQLQFLCTSNGVPNLFFIQKNSFLYPAFDPIEYCNQQVALNLENRYCSQVYFAEEKEKLGQIHFRYINHLLRYQREHLPDKVTLAQTHACPCMFVFGIGLGYHIARLYELVEVGTLIINEPDWDLFFASLFTFDWDNLLRFIHSEPEREIKFFIGLKPQEFKQQLEAFYLDGRNVLADFYWSMRHYTSPDIKAHEAVSCEFFNKLNTNIGFFDSRLFALSQATANIMQHTKFVKQLKFRGKLSEEARKLYHLTSNLTLPQSLLNTPVCVVANGPSLSNDLPFLRKVQDHVLIIACGTALETLYNAGIQPHFYAAIERLKQISDVISLIPDANYLKDIILLATDTIHPETSKLFNRQALFFKPDEPLLDMLEQRNPQLSYELEKIYCTNPLVGNMGLAAAASFGFKHIYMFGVDNGTARADKRQHPEESVTYSKIFSDTQHNVAREDQNINELNIEVPGNFVEKIYTNYLYKSSAFTMEVLIKNNADLQFFNCSNGCKINGAQPVHSESLLKSWLKLPSVKHSTLFSSLEQSLTMSLPLSLEELEQWCDKPLFNHIVLSFFKLLGIENEETSHLEINLLPDPQFVINEPHSRVSIEATQSALQTDEQPSLSSINGQTQQYAATSTDGAQDILVAQKLSFTASNHSAVNMGNLYSCTLPKFSSRLEVMQTLRSLISYMQSLKQQPRTKAILCFFNGSVMNFCTLTMRVMYMSENEEAALQRAREHLQTLAYMLDDARHLYINFAPFYCDYLHREYLKGKIGFDHENMLAPDVPAYVPAVTQKDRDLYPVRVFSKRYD